MFRPLAIALLLGGLAPFVLGPGCTCEGPPIGVDPGEDGGVPQEDGGAPACANDDECELGERCVEGACVPAVPDTIDDGCVADTDCAEGFLCAVTTGQCVADAATPGVPTGPPGPCNEGEQRTCGVKVGECDYGVELCAGGQWSGACTGAVGPAATDECNGLDEDCDGDVDEDFGVGQLCFEGLGECRRGGVLVCTPDGLSTECTAEGLDPTGRNELCGNELDDDCDGTTDDGFETEGAACAVGAPPCETPGTLECTANRLALECVVPLSGSELCNGIDDDNDSCIDEGFAVGGPCEVGTGACRRSGSLVCAAAGNDLVCNAQAGAPGIESCNNIDDDCNTVVDNGCDDDADGFCDVALGIGTTFPLPVCPKTSSANDRDCNDDAANGNPINPDANEICNDGRDQNCDGDQNDGCAACNPNIDADFDGSNQCDDCDETNGARRPGALERCNGFDDDCDNLIDELFDNDNDGFTTCGTILPGGGLDRALVDCNDNVSTTFPGPGSCDLCTNNGAPVACGQPNNDGNNVDDDCDGFVDETCFPCSNADTDNDGATGCDGDCDNTDPAVRPGVPEVCDGKDTDCNTFTVDNCDVGDGCNFDLDGDPLTPDPDECKDRLICVESLNAGGAPTGNFSCTSFCNTTAPGLGLGDSCDADETCGSRLTPTGNLHGCAVTTGFGAKAVNQTCGNDSECRSGICLRDGRFQGNVKYCSDFCGSDDYCPTGTTCQASTGGMSGQCLRIHPAQTLSPGETCTAATGPTCENGSASCVDTTNDGNPACQTGDACRCSDICCTNSDCPANEYCSLKGAVLPNPRGGVDTVPVCFAESGGNAGRPAGAACTTSAQCASEFCDVNLGVCIDVCCNDSTCPVGLLCESEVVTLESGAQTIARVCVNSSPADPLEAR